MPKTLLATAVIAALVSAPVMADSFKFKPIDGSADSANWNPAAPWKLPKGFTQTIVSDESNLNIYVDEYTVFDSDGNPVGHNDWHDMNTVNETGKRSGRYMYRTHEVRNIASGGAVSVVDLKTGDTKVLVQDPSWTALDGMEWTPWGTALFAEETTGGRLYELMLDPNDPTVGSAILRDQVGLLAHEGIQTDREGNVYVVDEQRGLTDPSVCGSTPCGGGIYKFVPDSYGDLSAGALYVLSIVNGDTFEGTGQAAWVGPIDPLNARASGSAAGGQSYQRPEDLEIIGDTLYVAITEGTRDADGNQNYDGRVIAVDLETLEVSDYVKPGVNVPVEIGRPGDADFQTGFDNPDNLAESPDGRLIIIEDNVPSDIWFAKGKKSVAKRVDLFASLSDPSAEGTGIYFSPEDDDTLYVNVQHSARDDGDGTWAITRADDHDDDK